MKELEEEIILLKEGLYKYLTFEIERMKNILIKPTLNQIISRAIVKTSRDNYSKFQCKEFNIPFFNTFKDKDTQIVGNHMSIHGSLDLDYPLDFTKYSSAHLIFLLHLRNSSSGLYVYMKKKNKLRIDIIDYRVTR